jgi:flagellar biosynthesis/type III secretory pathway M-ring protein FliF/YscJ
VSALGGMGEESNRLLTASDPDDGFLEALKERRENGVKQKLQKLVDFDEEHAARVLKRWIKEGASA